MDDGHTFAFENRCEQVYVGYSFADNMLSMTRESDEGCIYEGAYYQEITQVTFYGVE